MLEKKIGVITEPLNTFQSHLTLPPYLESLSNAKAPLSDEDFSMKKVLRARPFSSDSPELAQFCREIQAFSFEDKEALIASASKVETFTRLRLDSIEELKETVSPSNHFLLKICDDYARKYEISISVIVGTFTPFLESIKTPGFYGLISTYTEGHVIPILLNYQSEERKQALVLDSLGTQPYLELYQFALNYLKDWETFICPRERQADMVSCRTEAPLILRNALLDLKGRRGLVDLTDTFLDIEDNLVEISPSWDAHAQIYHQKSDEFCFKRDLFSSKEAKQRVPRTVGQFRDQYCIEATAIKTFCVTTNDWKLPGEADDYQESREDGSRTLSIKTNRSTGSTTIKLSHIRRKRVHAFLTLKAYRNAEKFGLAKIDDRPPSLRDLGGAHRK